MKNIISNGEDNNEKDGQKPSWLVKLEVAKTNVKQTMQEIFQNAKEHGGKVATKVMLIGTLGAFGLGLAGCATPNDNATSGGDTTSAQPATNNGDTSSTTPNTTTTTPDTTTTTPDNSTGSPTPEGQPAGPSGVPEVVDNTATDFDSIITYPDAYAGSAALEGIKKEAVAKAQELLDAGVAKDIVSIELFEQDNPGGYYIIYHDADGNISANMSR